MEVLNRVSYAAERFDGAPTLDELGSELTKNSPVYWPPASYAVRLSELSGLPRSWPLALYGANGRDGRVWAMVALALQRIERPGSEENFAGLFAAANDALSRQGSTTRGPVYDLLGRLGVWFPGDVPSEKAAIIAAIRQHCHEEAGRDAQLPPSQACDELAIERALAIAPDPRLRRVFENAPWIPRVAADGPSWWAAWVAAFVPLTLAAFWLANSLALRKAYLRRRPPELPPLHLDLVSQAPTHVRFAASIFQRAAQKLRLRTARPTDRIDIEASIRATIADGGEVLKPIPATSRHTPEYLVLVEQRSAGDQDSQRLRNFASRLATLLPITMYFYRDEPSHLEPEFSGKSVSIEQLQAQFPDHRLLILGAGAELLDPVNLRPRVGAEKKAQAISNKGQIVFLGNSLELLNREVLFWVLLLLVEHHACVGDLGRPWPLHIGDLVRLGSRNRPQKEPVHPSGGDGHVEAVPHHGGREGAESRNFIRQVSYHEAPG
jgi:hypothetical protein